MIKVNNLSLKFDDKTLYKNLDIYFEDGKLSVITGLNGTGKTTLLKVLSNELKIEDARVYSDFKKSFSYPRRFLILLV